MKPQDDFEERLHEIVSRALGYDATKIDTFYDVLKRGLAEPVVFPDAAHELSADRVLRSLLKRLTT